MNKEFDLKLKQRILRTPSIESFRFSSEALPDFVPGQYLELLFDESGKENRELNKYLSFSSAPGKGYVEVTKRLSDSAFSSRLKALRPGDRVRGQGPLGSCVFKEQYKKIGFLIGGIGITPVISIIEYIVDRKFPVDPVLFYSNRTYAETAFKKELDSWQSVFPLLNIVYTITDEPFRETGFCQGRIDRGLIEEKAADISEREIFIYGPPAMVEAMTGLAVELGCKKERLHTERFIGY